MRLFRAQVEPVSHRMRPDPVIFMIVALLCAYGERRLREVSRPDT